MKKKLKKIISSILLCTVLAGCSDSTPSHEIPLNQSSSCPVSTMRTGTARQGIKGYGNSFECTQEGSYFMLDEAGAGSWLLYADHGSDTFIKLCGRPDCNHIGTGCNARFSGGTASICYYDGFLYTFDLSSGDIIRINLDGTERTTVYNVSSFEKQNGFKGRWDQKIMNGVLFITEIEINDKGENVGKGIYYKLDGSMKEPELADFLGIHMYADGENFVGVVDNDPENELYIFGLWDSDKGVTDELFTIDDVTGYGYYGTKARYYVENGVIIEDSYAEGKKELINTGLKGDYQLACFPDCMVMYEKDIVWEEKTLYFYDWDYNSLGSVKIDYEFHDAITGFICGETPERIFLTDNLFYAPRYYINKSDFGTGNIEIHTLNVPDSFIFFGE